MAARGRATAGRSYDDFQPSSDWLTEDGSDTLVLRLPGFNKDNLRVQLDSNGNLKVSGERPLDGNRSSRFHKEVRIPENCITSDIRAMFENGTLHVKMPKTSPWIKVTEQISPTKESRSGQETSKTQDSEKDRADAHLKPSSTTTGDDTTKKADTEKQMNGSKDAAKSRDETKKKEEEEYQRTPKKFAGSTEMEDKGGLLNESYMHGAGGLMIGLDESRKLMVNVVIGLLVMLVLLLYILHKFIS